MDIGSIVNIVIFALTVAFGLIGWGWNYLLNTRTKTDNNTTRIDSLEEDRRDNKALPQTLATLQEAVNGLRRDVQKLEAAVNRDKNQAVLINPEGT
jgi:hypothetical protein